jgi:phosphoserine phosphatase RsbU/P
MADVRGKGMSAAILMASFQASLRAFVKVGRNLEDIIHDLNDRVWQNAKGERFITLFLAKYNSTSGKIHYINAAHPSPLLIYGDNSILLEDGCVGLGMFEELPFVNIGKTVIGKGALFICYTDGLNELENDQDIPFEIEILEELVRKTKIKSMDQLNNTIMDALHLHKGELDFHDDIALISCCFL